MLASTANYVSQKIMGCKEINQRSICAYALFGYAKNIINILSFEFFHSNFVYLSLLFGGTVPHYANKLGAKYLAGHSKMNQLLIFFACERFIFTPTFQMLSLYFLSIFEVCDSLNLFIKNSKYFHRKFIFNLFSKGKITTRSFK